MAHHLACVGTTVVPRKGEATCPQNYNARATSSRAHRTIYKPLEPPGICHQKEICKWRLLHDLRKIDAVMESVGAYNQACHPLQGFLSIGSF